MLYIATSEPLPVQSRGRLTVEAVDIDVDAQLAPSFTKPHRRFVGVDGGCSCGFAYVITEQRFEYYEGMFSADSASERAEATGLVRDLLGIVEDVLREVPEAEILPAWANREHLAPKGRIEIRRQDIVPEHFFFIEQFLYVVRP